MPIATEPLPAGPADPAWWRAAADALAAAAHAQGVRLADTVWLLPFAALLPAARRACAERGGWPPRIETPGTWAAQLAPAPPLPSGAYSGDIRRDAFHSRARLRQTRWGDDWARRDPGAFEAGVARLLETSGELAAHAATLAPTERSAWFADARATLAAGGGPGQIEAQMARMALDWLGAEPGGASDALFAQRPALLAALQAGGADALTERLLQAQAARGAPALRLVADGQTPWAPVTTLPALAALADAEAEAQAVAAALLARLQAGADAPQALVALERRVVRRVHALLVRAGVAVQDDTGWRLPTTRAGARVMQALRAAQAHPGGDASDRDAWLAWLKDAPWPEPAAVDALEALWRRRSLTPARRAQAEALEREAQARLAPWQGAGERRLAEWLALLAEAAPPETHDPAAAEVARALVPPAGIDPPLRLSAFTAWVDAALEQAVYVPPLAHAPQVVITPLARAMLRPFAAVWIPAADAQRLGHGEPPPGLLTPAQRAALGLPGADALRQRNAWLLAQVLRQPAVHLSWHRAEDGRPLAESPLLAQLALQRGALPAWPAALAAPPTATWPAQPPAPPLPDASAARWPPSLSASALAAWRACPYQFFARTLLGLAADEEFDADRTHADHGNWLHTALHHFHTQRSGTDDAGELRAAAAAAQAELGLTDAELLPWRAAFEALLPPYLAWLHARDAQGWRYRAGEFGRQGHGLHGRIDRLDSGPAARVQLLDYKSGSAQRLKDALKRPLEDTQLMVYAALALQAGDTVADGLSAAYLPLGEADKLAELPNPAVADALTVWWPAVQAELARARAGEPLRALGQGAACTHCLARGLCRRDTWADDVAPQA